MHANEFSKNESGLSLNGMSIMSIVYICTLFKRKSESARGFLAPADRCLAAAPIGHPGRLRDPWSRTTAEAIASAANAKLFGSGTAVRDPPPLPPPLAR